jgi:LCP family protein required for cell wall assembly
MNDAFLGPTAPAAATHAAPPGSRRHRRRFWARRHPFLSILLVLFIFGAVGAGILINRATSTVSSLQSLSTPPPVVALVPEAGQPTGSSPDDGAALAAAVTSTADNQTPESTVDGQAAIADVPQTPTSQTSQPIDTKPAQDALAAAGMDFGTGGGVLNSIRGRANNVSDLAQGAVAVSGVGQTTLPPMTILLMGVDARPGEAIDIGVRPDALAVLHLDPATGSCRMLAIPRDSRVDLPGYGLSKINHALAVGGIPYQELVVQNFLDITIDKYALIDFGGITDLVDAVGGVPIHITDSFNASGMQFDPGDRTLNGDEALAYSRYRNGPDGDFGRIRRQQQVLRAILSRASTMKVTSLVQEVLPQLDSHVRTDLSPLEMIALGTKFASTCTDETLVTMKLDGTVATFDDPLFNMPLSYVVIDPAEVQRKVEELMGTS